MLEHSIEAWCPSCNMPTGHQDHADHGHGHALREDAELSGRLPKPAAYIRANKLQLGRDIVFLISADANHYGRDFDNIPFGEDEKPTSRESARTGASPAPGRRHAG